MYWDIYSFAFIIATTTLFCGLWLRFGFFRAVTISTVALSSLAFYIFLI